MHMQPVEDKATLVPLAQHHHRLIGGNRLSSASPLQGVILDSLLPTPALAGSAPMSTMAAVPFALPFTLGQYFHMDTQLHDYQTAGSAFTNSFLISPPVAGSVAGSVASSVAEGVADGVVKSLKSKVAIKSPTEANNEFVFGLMERVWHGSFNLYVTAFQPHAWYLMPIEAPPSQVSAVLSPANLYLPSLPWRTFRDSAKVRFCCDSCGNGWTSMKGRVIFWFHQDPASLTGYVLFKLYGQQCKRCSNGQFEHAMWYPDEVVKVIENLYNRIGQVYYYFYRPPIRIERRSGKPREQHNAELCQACKEGLCKEELMFT